MKGVSFVYRRYTKGVPCLSKMVGDLGHFQGLWVEPNLLKMEKQGKQVFQTIIYQKEEDSVNLLDNFTSLPYGDQKIRLNYICSLAFFGKISEEWVKLKTYQTQRIVSIIRGISFLLIPPLILPTTLWIETHQPWARFVIHQSLTTMLVQIVRLHKSTL